MGEKAQIGPVIYNVFDSRWLTQLGTGPQARVPNNRFLVIRLSAVNSGAGEAAVPSMMLVDDNGTTYTELPNGDQVPHWLGTLRRIQPAQTEEGEILFDVAPRHYKLRITDEAEQKVGLVDIPLSFGSEIPAVPLNAPAPPAAQPPAR